VYGAHMPSLPGKLKLQWKGKDPAEKLYLKLKGQALTAKVCALCVCHVFVMCAVYASVFGCVCVCLTCAERGGLF
jgi:hypothetical protein